MCKTMNELAGVVAEYREMKALKEELDALLKDLEREIIGYLDTNEKLSETGNDFSVKISTCERRTLDAKRLESDLGSLAESVSLSIDAYMLNKAKINAERAEMPFLLFRQYFICLHTKNAKISPF